MVEACSSFEQTALLSTQTNSACLKILNNTNASIQIFDIQDNNVKLLWANAAALRVWNTPTIETLQDHDFAIYLNNERLLRYRKELEMGREVKEVWTIYPTNNNSPRRLMCRSTSISLSEEGILGFGNIIDFSTPQQQQAPTHIGPGVVRSFMMVEGVLDEGAAMVCMSVIASCCRVVRHVVVP